MSDTPAPRPAPLPAPASTIRRYEVPPVPIGVDPMTPDFIEGLRLATQQIEERFDGVLSTFLRRLSDPMHRDNMRAEALIRVGIPIDVTERGGIAFPTASSDPDVARRQYALIYDALLGEAKQALLNAVNTSLIRLDVQAMSYADMKKVLGHEPGERNSHR